MSKESRMKVVKLEFKIRSYSYLNNEIINNSNADSFDAKPIITILNIMKQCKMNINNFSNEYADILDKSLDDIISDKKSNEKFDSLFNHLCEELDKGK